MGLTHIRTPKNFVLEERLERYGAVIEQQPERYRGRWAEACWPLGETTSEAQTAAGSASTPPAATKAASGAMGAATKTGSPEQPNAFASVHLDLGCGKGSYLIARAQQEPSTLFIGMDTEPICVAYSAQYITEAGLANAVVLPRGAAAAARIFAAGELAAITLNFPTPHPKRHHARKRLRKDDQAHRLPAREAQRLCRLVLARVDRLHARAVDLGKIGRVIQRKRHDGRRHIVHAQQLRPGGPDLLRQDGQAVIHKKQL